MPIDRTRQVMTKYDLYDLIRTYYLVLYKSSLQYFLCQNKLSYIYIWADAMIAAENISNYY